MSKLIKREMLTEAMLDIKTAAENVNKILSPNKKIQPHKGAHIGGIHTTTDENGNRTYLRSICLPQWVVTGKPSKVFYFFCTENGEFVRWR